MALKKQNKKKSAAKRAAVTWAQSSFESGPFKGKFWGALFGSEFFMIVPRSDDKGAYFEVWRDGVVHDEARNATLAKAQAFAATLAVPKAA